MSRRVAGLSVAAGLVLAGYLLVQLLDYKFGNDQATFAVIADGILEGEVPYRDHLEIKPPVIFGIYALAQSLFGKNQASVRILESCALLSLLPAFAILSRRFLGYRSAAWIGFLLAVLFHVPLGFWHTGQAESFAGIVVVWALVAITTDPRGRGRRYLCWAGGAALFTLAIFLKFPLGGGLVLCSLLVGWRRWRATARWVSGLEVLLVAMSSSVTVTALICLPFLVAGADRDVEWVFGSVLAGYANIRSAAPFADQLAKAVREPFFRIAPLALPAITALTLLPRQSRREREGVLLVAAAMLPQVLGVALQGKFFFYHYGGVLPLLALLSGWGLWKAFWLLRRQVVVPALLALIAAWLQVQTPSPFWYHNTERWKAWRYPGHRTAIEDRLYSALNLDQRSIRQVVAWLQTHTGEDSNILVWGFNPTIYFLSDRRPASRFVNHFPLRFPWAQARALELLMEDLASRPPSAVVVRSGDHARWVTGHDRDSVAEIVRLPALEQYLDRHFVTACSFREFTLLARADSPAATDGVCPIFTDGFESGDASAWTRRQSTSR